jgi:hypothetical protein|nr:MAG TPA: Endonuclease [Caudoviricetes sp.]
MLFKHKVTYKGIEFDSRDEMNRYIELMDMEKSGLISGLRRQYSFMLIPRQSKMVVKHLKTKDKTVEKFLENPAIYTCDFLYKEGNIYVIEDTKSWFSRSQADDYPLRRKLMVQKIQIHNVKGHGQWIFREFIVGTKKKPGKIIDR